MLEVIDRVQLLVPDAAAVAGKWAALLGAEHDGEDRVSTLAAKRLSMRLGSSVIELLEPDGAGVAAEALKARGRGHLYAAGISTPDLAALARRLDGRGVEAVREHGQLFVRLAVEGVPVPLVISQHEDRAPAGDVSFLYETTLLVKDAPAAVTLFAETFGLDDGGFEPIASEPFGYAGTLSLFNAARLHRFEIISPTDVTKTMGRYFAREGVSYYMAFCESACMAAIEQRAAEAGLGMTVDRPEGRGRDMTPDQMWLHPPALGGMMLGLSRPTMAWAWSGHPDRVRPVDAGTAA